MNAMLIAILNSRSRIVSIPIERHHICSRCSPLLLLPLLTLLNSLPIHQCRFPSNKTLITPSLRITIRLEGISTWCEEVHTTLPGRANRTPGSDEAGHFLLVDNIGVLVVEGSETEKLLEQLPGAD